MGLSLLGQAAGMFAVTNIDDLLILAVFFGRATGARAWRIVAGQYLGFLGILVVSVVGALGAGLLPEALIPYLGLLPLFLGLRAGWSAWRTRHDDESADGEPSEKAPGPLQVAAVTFANGGDNIGVYVPVFTVAGPGGMTIYAGVFLVGVALWCAAGWFLATRPPVARALSRWGHVVLPVVLMGIGLIILLEGLAG
ncbi:cadmium resistance transporter [Winogradskya consettensis]|uniref:Cadmium transporter n=1 Tax=Winogradskya consettensis TaxID=113560 RepID=A0A919VZE6_9ACTN|nr:cadmium resistance transporter [Actinoplanes consettensis]GIM74563.1 cadmium transporter [Actinoplanes consettensis]